MVSARQRFIDDLASGGLANVRAYRTEELRRRGQESQTPYGRQVLPPMVAAVAAVVAERIKPTPGAGRRKTVWAHLAWSSLDPDEIALITCRVVLDRVSGDPRKLVATSVAVAEALETEEAARRLLHVGKLDAAKTIKELNERTRHAKHRASTIRTYEKAWTGEKKWLWTKAQHVLIGSELVEVVAEATGLIQVTLKKLARNKIVYFVEPTESFIDWILSGADANLIIPSKLPVVDPLKPWAALKGGGYDYGGRPTALVKSGAYKRLVGEVDFSLVFDAMNTMQETQWEVNGRVLDTARALKASGRTVGKLVTLEGLTDFPPKPADLDDNEQARKDWRKRASEHYKARAKTRGRLMQSCRLLEIASQMRDDTFRFPYQLDFRGRAYCVPQHLTYQGNDLARGLLRFARGKPISHECGRYWLLVHAANSWGESKISFDARVKWAEDHLDQIVAVARDPIGVDWWLAADKPWQFLAACFEVQEAEDHGDGYISKLPIPMDGSCNGLQNLSAMLLDPVGGAATNLLPSETPSDVYAQVAAKVVEALEADRDEPLASQWLAFGVGRSLVKRPVMVTPYGGTQFSCRQYLEDVVREAVDKGQVIPWDPTSRDILKATLYLSKLVWAAIKDTVVAAHTVMHWLKEVASLVGSRPLRWIVPDGFVAVQAYPVLDEVRVETIAFGKCRKLTAHVEGTDIDARRMRTGAAPNFVHSLDAAAMRGYVRLARHNGITDFGLVHDSFATLAADTDVSMACIREAFIELYRDNNVLEQFRSSVVQDYQELEASIPPVPERGSLDIEEVRDSLYFFA